jgi:hypothetical protein
MNWRVWLITPEGLTHHEGCSREGIRLLVRQPFYSVLLSLMKGCITDALASSLAGNSSSLAAFSPSFFSPLSLEVLVGLYRQGTEQGDETPPLLCIHEKYASAVACSRQQIVRHTTSLVHEGYSPMRMIFPCMHMCYTRGVCWDTDYLWHATYKYVYLVSGCLCLQARGTAGLHIHTACMQRSWLHLTYARDKNFELVTI